MKDSQSSAKQCLANYFLNNLANIDSLTLQVVALETNTSYATVCRFIKELGMPGFKEFKKTVGLELADASRTDDIYADTFLDFLPSDSFSTISRHICDFAGSVISNVRTAVSDKDAARILDYFKRANHIHFFGLGTSSVSAQYAYIKFFRLKSACSYSADIVISKMTAALLKENDILFVFSSSGRTKSIIEAAKLAREQKAIVISVNDFINSPLTGLADINICTTIRDANKYIDSDFPLIQGQITIIDILHKYIYTEMQNSSAEKFSKTVSAVQADKMREQP